MTQEIFGIFARATSEGYVHPLFPVLEPGNIKDLWHSPRANETKRRSKGTPISCRAMCGAIELDPGA